mmetsp:Transcript_9021/g.11640  ORF Transcript_9021/g.11640 Transcript_9021/m.11640 type:complete len:119 (+) Transcript_9021:143-499(+)|eukprot:CAMPEP_0116066480 /NCGR_PEP_ID=MMETSP0322-20121206/10401_1 /TAXON_ID=163516 /ORGANISM="Leptocylindrus danicus var. apora, Strain B651" /LENGTH=118 /DNA_ID=CAMNT_0003553029 /DNA_START=107 /DNA_END=463 /DNA_ORIENTATION=+
MAITNLTELSASQKEELVASLACLVIASEETSAESLSAVAEASGNELSEGVAALFATVVSKAGGIDKFCAAPGSGGGGGSGGDAGEAEAVVEEEEEEEEEADIGGGMDMFGGGDDGDY